MSAPFYGPVGCSTVPNSEEFTSPQGTVRPPTWAIENLLLWSDTSCLLILGRLALVPFLGKGFAFDQRRKGGGYSSRRRRFKQSMQPLLSTIGPKGQRTKKPKDLKISCVAKEQRTSTHRPIKRSAFPTFL